MRNKYLGLAVNGKNITHFCKQPNTDADLCCWYDSEPIGLNKQICRMPIDRNELKDIWTLNGAFCSWECAKGYNLRFMNDCKMFDRMSRIRRLAKLVNGISGVTGEISIAHSRECLKKFGGKMSIEEFRNNNNSVVYYIEESNIIDDLTGYPMPEPTHYQIKSKEKKQKLHVNMIKIVEFDPNKDPMPRNIMPRNKKRIVRNQQRDNKHDRELRNIEAQKEIEKNCPMNLGLKEQKINCAKLAKRMNDIKSRKQKKE